MHRGTRSICRLFGTSSNSASRSRLTDLRNKLQSDTPSLSTSFSAFDSTDAVSSIVFADEHIVPTYTYAIKTYGCQMNQSDTALIRGLLNGDQYGVSGGGGGDGRGGRGGEGGGRPGETGKPENNADAGEANGSTSFEKTERFVEVSDESVADIVLTNTCAIREGAESKVWQRLRSLRSEDDAANKGVKKELRKDRVVGVLGCMAERLKTDILNDKTTNVDLVVGPDSYRELPGILKEHMNKKDEGGSCLRTDSTKLSFTETYKGVMPVLSGEVSEHVSVMRGCNNMCSYCVVPFTRGRERSRDIEGVLEEVRYMVGEGVKEITLLGQNVNSYHDKSALALESNPNADYNVSNPLFTNMYNLRGGGGWYFADLVDKVSMIDPEVRVRFTSPHPKDYPTELISIMRERSNVCSHLHMPAQSGNTAVLERMRRGYGREGYLKLIEDVREGIPGVCISSDFITGFCGETEEEHRDTISLMEEVVYDHCFMFAYSMRGKTHAHRNMRDDVEEGVKKRRLGEIIEVFRKGVQEKNDREEVGELRLVLVEGEGRREGLTGKTDGGKRVGFDFVEGRNIGKGEYAVVEITRATGHTLRGEVRGRSGIKDWEEGRWERFGEVVSPGKVNIELEQRMDTSRATH